MKSEWLLQFRDRLKSSRMDFILLALLIGGLIFQIASPYLFPEARAEVSREDETAIDELIPEGFVLFPIEFQNQSALLSMIQSSAVVNIYRVNPETQMRGKILGRDIRLVRSAGDGDQLAALLPEQDVPRFVNEANAFYAVIRNRKSLSKSQISRGGGHAASVQYFSDAGGGK